MEKCILIQLGILATYSGDELMAVYRYFRSLAVESPFPTARDNLIVAFEKVFLNSYGLLDRCFSEKGYSYVDEFFKDVEVSSCFGWFEKMGITVLVQRPKFWTPTE